MKKDPITPIQCRDTALAVIFLLLLIWFFIRENYLVYAAGAFTLYAMLLPKTLSPLARAWFGFSHILGQIMSRVLLGLIYILLVLPIALLRKAMGKDSLRLRGWKKGDESAFVVRNHQYGKEDLSHLF
ncbi:SxtJ family membrane protein [Desulfovibrio sp. OttesenSCG-928-M14]|nr:SxtJ family membrane protein [Desulfovibrio sp. OttesenSCG-928-M14]